MKTCLFKQYANKAGKKYRRKTLSLESKFLLSSILGNVYDYFHKLVGASKKTHTKNKNERGAPLLGLAKSIYYCKVFFVGFCFFTEESRWRTAVFVSRSRGRKGLSTNQNGNRKVTWGHKEPVPCKTHSLLRTYNSITEGDYG